MFPKGLCYLLECALSIKLSTLALIRVRGVLVQLKNVEDQKISLTDSCYILFM